MKKILLLAIASIAAEIFIYFSALNTNMFGAYNTLILYYSTLVITSVLFIQIFAQHIITRKHIKALKVKKNHNECKFQEQQVLFNSIFENNSVGVAIFNLDGHVTRVNHALCELLVYREEDLLAMNFYHLVHPTNLNEMQIHIQKLLDKDIKSYQTEQFCYQKNGEKIWILASLSLIRDRKDRPAYFIAQIQNLTLQKKSEERLRHMAYYDSLTGLANRNKLEQFVVHILAASRRHQQSFALLLIDLDRFKSINDTLGHEAGDLVLQVIAERLRGIVRSVDIVARLGGDEFVVLLTDVKKSESIAIIAQKILESVLEEIVVMGKEIYITASIGVSIFPDDGQNVQALMKNADLSMYRAKDGGRNNYQFYTLEMTNRAQEKMSLQNALAHALAKNEFLLNYQPEMELSTRKITSVEVLLRWKNKEFISTTPDQIIALAEETGLIIPVSEWIMTSACKQLKNWHNAGYSSLILSVNCTARQFKQANFVDDIVKVISEVNFSPHLLEIEITESLIMQDPENSIKILYALKDLGVSISIDDFGTGYWSLSNLRKLSVDKIKIDKTFIKQLAMDETSAQITSAIIAMANKLGIKSVAEGVETRAQYQFLLNEKCTEIQGYYLTQPLSSELMTAYLKHPIPNAEAIANVITE